ncbi:GNAT family N-acetyltransferase [Octadecabacter sp. R77987]|uniref:GNAT family N-acetyltransferase n=1 Tax=Octadecabacter sp. R77987 TaxID=3093874 RepID=UPI00367135AE
MTLAAGCGCTSPCGDCATTPRSNHKQTTRATSGRAYGGNATGNAATCHVQVYAAFAPQLDRAYDQGMTAPSYHHLDHTNAHLIARADVFDHPVDQDQLAGFLADDGHELIFAMQGDTVIGFASGVVLRHPDKHPAFFLNEVGVNPPHQRRGIGATLCEKLIALARERGCRGIWLATETDNVPARALYRSLSARETEAVVVYDWDDAMSA